MEKPEWNCNECETYFFWGIEQKPTKAEMKLPAVKQWGHVIGIPHTKKQWEQAHLRISKCAHQSIAYNEIKKENIYKQCGVKIKLCQKCKNKIKKLKKKGLVK